MLSAYKCIDDILLPQVQTFLDGEDFLNSFYSCTLNNLTIKQLNSPLLVEMSKVWLLSTSNGQFKVGFSTFNSVIHM